jgi:hypothetical protein
VTGPDADLSLAIRYSLQKLNLPNVRLNANHLTHKQRRIVRVPIQGTRKQLHQLMIL